MKFLLASGFQHLPQIYGGVMSNTHEIALELTQRGHQAAVVADLNPNDRIGIQTRLMGKLFSKKAVHDRVLGYRVYRRWEVLKALPDLIEVIKPDVAIVQPSHHIAISQELNRLGVPVIVYFHDVEFDRIDGDPRSIDGAAFLSNSEFTAKKYKDRYGIDSTVIAPLFRADAYRTISTKQNVTFINPQPLKGVDLALKIVASCPEIPFSFVESWELQEEHLKPINDQMNAASNLSLRRRTLKMKEVYGRAKVVLAPSQWEEAWGRVASEAQFSGIPVVASNRGGLPEAVGPGGILLDPDGPIEAWVQAIRRLWTDEAHYKTVSDAALAYSERPAIDPTVQIDTLLNVARTAIEQRGPSRSQAAQGRDAARLNVQAELPE